MRIKPTLRSLTSRRSPSSRRAVLRLETLEDRTLPSTLAVLNLSDTGVAGDGSLRGEITAAQAGDTIVFKSGLSGTITLASEIAIHSDLTITGPGASQLTISGNNASRVFDVSGGTVTLTGLTIAGGLATSSAPNGSKGGAIYHGGGTLNLSGDVFSGNMANGTNAGDLGFGGAILNASGATLSVTASTFTGNVATGLGKGRGGAVYNQGTATVTSSTFTNNQALGGTSGNSISSGGSGGALADRGAGDVPATLTVTGSTFTDNLAQGGTGTAGAGGAIWLLWATASGNTVVTDSVVVTNSTFTGNRAEGGSGDVGQGGEGIGGAILVSSNGASVAAGDLLAVSTLSVTACTFTNNEADGGGGGGHGSGGAIYTNGDLANSTVSSSTFTGNQARGGDAGGTDHSSIGSDGLAFGGAIGTGAGGSLSVTRSWFAGNLARGGAGSDAWGGAIANFAQANPTAGADQADSSVTISQTTFTDNQAVGGNASSGNGGNAYGGALFNGGTAVFGSTATFALKMNVSDSLLRHNQAIGGTGSTGNNGGNATGGGLFNGLGAAPEVPTATLSNTTIVNNKATGGAAGTGGTAGQGSGGDVSSTGILHTESDAPYLSAQELAVQALYLDALGRPGSKAELDGWLAGLPANATALGTAIAAGIEGSPEAEDHLVKGWYRTYLGRSADGTEELCWVNMLQAGQSEAQVLGNILASDEYFNRAQPGTADTFTPNEHFVASVFASLINPGSTPNPGSLEATNLGNALSAGTITRQQVALLFLQPPELRQRQIAGYYSTLLHRAGSASEVSGWMADLDLHSIRVGIEASPEFFANG
jgi:hypothetical protein